MGQREGFGSQGRLVQETVLDRLPKIKDVCSRLGAVVV